ncbi:hypothetical protein DEU56DRAFT_910042 [Suillus clintonianus]|uniref:uncharacterized protein n=1 Tax=Suillus clintonianus TaxID=1904413 RepID=UPI001B866655|nr:uncharacterized protein DEU56DRAFT_910042 [Suillus clintonianus]KAG2145756.1 hypothetical protein DEU56DRAFT_910042 [Suillus clintonianus]
MASTSTQTPAATTRMGLTPVMALKGNLPITSISYFPNGKRMISGSSDETVRRWDLQEGKEIKEARIVCKEEVHAVAVSRDGRWVITGGGESGRVELKACKVETGIVTSFEGHSGSITCVDVSADCTLLASGSWDVTARIWSLKTGELMAGPFRSVDWVGSVRLSTDSKKLAVKSWTGRWLEVWDVKTQTLDVRVGNFSGPETTSAPVFWTHQNQNILTAFVNSDATRISEFNASTLETVGTSFAGHTKPVTGLALSFDGALLASASPDDTIKLWAFESRQLLASFDVQQPTHIILSPNSRQLAHTTSSKGDYKIYICNTPPDILVSIGLMPKARHALSKTNPTFELLESDATRRRRNPATFPAISFPPRLQQPLPATDSQQPTFLHHLRRFLRLSSPTNAAPPVRHDQSRDPFDFPATSPLPPNRSLSAQATTQFDNFEISYPPSPSNGVTQFLQQHLSFLTPRHSNGPPVVEVAAGRKFTRLAAAKLPEYRKVDDTRHPSGQQPGAPQDTESSDIDSLPDVHWCKAFLCYYSCWSHGRLRAPPRWRLERVDIPRQDGATTSNRAPAHGGS